MREDASTLKLMRAFFSPPENVTPPQALPGVKTDLSGTTGERPVINWFGHSSYLIRYQQFNLLVDPVFSGYASPVKLFGKAFNGSDIYTVDDLPSIDLLVITHDHYDHLDYKTLLRLKGKVKKVITPLGVGAHLEYWGWDPAIITELDWQEAEQVTDRIRITALPARHFSGRGTTRGKTLWASYALKLDSFSIYLGGDSGYGKHFKAIGEQYGPFDIAMLENGQYGADWPLIHMFPEEVVQAAIDLKAKTVLPVHWGKFKLANHPWIEPLQRFLLAAGQAGIPVSVPRIGESYRIGDPVMRDPWWEVK